MARIERLAMVITALRELQRRRGEGNVAVIVGFSQKYAVYVHENTEARHPVGQAKFLEQPARLLKGELADIVRTAVRRGKTLLMGLILAGLRLQRESQERCPVDTGALKGSAFTREDK